MWYQTRYATDKVVIFVDTDEGVTGIGEARYMQTTKTIIEQIIKPKIVGLDPFDIESIGHKFWAKDPSSMQYTAYTYLINAVGGIEIALWDIIGKVLKKPVFKLIGGRYRDRVPCRAWLPTKEPKEQAKDAVNFVQRGWRALKIKIGTNPEKDVETVKTVREAVGDKIEIGVDVNGAWTPGIAKRTIKKMEKYDLSHVEQPVAAHDLNGMAHVRRCVNVPILACDPMLATKYDILEIVRKEAADMINVDPIRAGGLIECKKNCAIAEAAGISVCTHSTEELGIGTAALLHLVTSTSNFLTPNDSAYHHLADDIISNRFNYNEGCLNVPDRNGLGVDLDMEKLKKYHLLYKSGDLKSKKGLGKEDGNYYWFKSRRTNNSR
jgi:glucarate dehydratase